MRALPNIFKEAMAQIQIPLSEISRVTGVSPRQIRYWEAKGFLTSHQAQKNQSHKYIYNLIYIILILFYKFNFFTLTKVLEIKEYLDQGFTLQAAVEKQKGRKNIALSIHRFIAERLLATEEKGKTVEINLGPLDNDETKVVVAKVEVGQPVIIILKKHQPLD